MTTDNTTDYKLPSGEIVTISIDVGGTEISVTDSRDEIIGRIEFDSREDLRGREEYFLTWAYLDMKGEQYKRQGIGRAALKFHQDLFDPRIHAQSHDGLRRDDGSHLTQDAPGFVAAMREEGVIEPDHWSKESDEEEGVEED